MGPFNVNVLFQGSSDEYEHLQKQALTYGRGELKFEFLGPESLLMERARELNNESALIILVAKAPTSLVKLQVFISQLEEKTAAQGFEMVRFENFTSEQKLFWPISQGQDVQAVQQKDRANLADALVPSGLFYYPRGYLQGKDRQEVAPLYVPGMTQSPPPLQKALFLDRDGVVIKDAGYHVDPNKIEFIPETLELMTEASLQGHLILILTNQSGVARGLFEWDQVDELHQALEVKLQERGVDVNGWFTSPYHFKSGQGRYKKHSLTRKPGAGLVLEALEKWPIDLSASLMIGDKPSDDLDIPGLKTLHLKGAYDLCGVSSPVISSPLEALEYLV